MRSGLFVLMSVVAVGLVSAVVAFAQHEADDAFIAEQSGKLTIRAADVERAVVVAPEPVASGKGRRGQKAVCEARGRDRSRWYCLVSYPAASFVEYDVRLDPDGRFRGADDTGKRRISGCCVRSSG
jgi:hypothetical protein